MASDIHIHDGYRVEQSLSDNFVCICFNHNLPWGKGWGPESVVVGLLVLVFTQLTYKASASGLILRIFIEWILDAPHDAPMSHRL